eukprot:6491993-Amphidinium_carterae.2
MLKSDGGPCIVELKKEAVKKVRELAKVESILEASEVAETSGVIEQAVKAIKGKVRTLKFATKEFHGTPIPETHSMLTWRVGFAGQIMSRSHRYSGDRQTAFELRKSKKYRRALPVFAEKVLVLGAGKHRVKVEPRAIPGIFVGICEKTDMLQERTADGIMRVTNVRWLPEAVASNQVRAMENEGIWTKACLHQMECRT